MTEQNTKKSSKHKTSIGGQALIEGVMMRGPKKIAIAVRKPNKEIELDVKDIDNFSSRHKFFKLPLIRGVVGLIDSLKVGISALMYSAEFFEEEETTTDKETLLKKVFKDKAEDVEMFLTLVTAILISTFIFMILPNFITGFFKNYIEKPLILNLVEGIIRILIFLIYVIWVSKLDDVRRVFEYHGAEHKSIHCYESGDELTVENVKKYSILHPRCGTSFLFMVMFVSIVVLSFFGWPDPVKRLLIRVFMLPVIAGISYEINRFIGRSESKVCYYISYPGLLIQKIATVKEPDDEQIEVAIVSLKAVLPTQEGEDKW